MAKKEEDNVEDLIDAGRAQGGTTATGQEAARRDGTEDERLDSQESRGGPEPDDQIKPDAIATKGVKPIGMQAEPAIFVANGSIPPNHVASNSGLVPVSAITNSKEVAEERNEQETERRVADAKSRKSSRTRVDDALIEKMSGAELRAVGHDRGYELSDTAGTRGTRSAFRRAQDEDEYLEEVK